MVFFETEIIYDNETTKPDVSTSISEINKLNESIPKIRKRNSRSPIRTRVEKGDRLVYNRKSK